LTLLKAFVKSIAHTLAVLPPAIVASVVLRANLMAWLYNYIVPFLKPNWFLDVAKKDGNLFSTQSSKALEIIGLMVIPLKSS